MRYLVVKKDAGSNFLSEGTLLQPPVGSIFYGTRVERNLCLYNSEQPTIPVQCGLRPVVMGKVNVPIGGIGGVEFYFPSNYVRAVIPIGGTYVKVRTIVGLSAVALIAYLYVKRKRK